MTILFLSHMFPNAANPVNGTFVLELAKFMHKKNPVVVISPIPFFPFMGRTKKYRGYEAIPKEAVLKGVQAYYPRFFMLPRYGKWLDGFFYFLCTWKSVHRIVDSSDAIVAHWTYPDAFAGVLWGRLKRKKTVLIVHGNESFHYYDPISLKKRLIGWTLKNVDHIIAVSNDLKEKITRSLHIAENKVTVIPNGVDLEEFPDISMAQARSRLGIPQSEKILLTVARLSPEKLLHVLVGAIDRFRDKTNLMLYIIGDGPERSRLEAMIRERNLGSHIVLLGSVPHEKIHLWLCASDLFLLPSEQEGCPVVIGEAFACGVPVVATTVGGVPDLIVNDKLGILTEPNSEASLCSAMETALSRAWDREYIKIQGSRLSWEGAAGQLLGIIADSPMKR